MRNSTIKQTGERKALRKVVEREPFIPSLLSLDDWAAFGDRDYPGTSAEARQALLRLKLRREHGQGTRGDVVGFDRTNGTHAASKESEVPF